MPNGFDEAWLQEYRARIAGCKSPPAASVETPSLVTFTLAKPTLLLNQILLMHWAQQREYKRSLSAAKSLKKFSQQKEARRNG